MAKTKKKITAKPAPVVHMTTKEAAAAAGYSVGHFSRRTITAGLVPDRLGKGRAHLWTPQQVAKIARPEKLPIVVSASALTTPATEPVSV